MGRELLDVWFWGISLFTVFGPAPMRIARPDGAIVLVISTKYLVAVLLAGRGRSGGYM
jgi:hypothetical protein